jgi:hypothetical protein
VPGPVQHALFALTVQGGICDMIEVVETFKIQLIILRDFSRFFLNQYVTYL